MCYVSTEGTAKSGRYLESQMKIGAETVGCGSVSGTVSERDKEFTRERR